jgi:hypothetical protein
VRGTRPGIVEPVMRPATAVGFDAHQ